jgi:hypothetical protein
VLTMLRSLRQSQEVVGAQSTASGS